MCAVKKLKKDKKNKDEDVLDKKVEGEEEEEKEIKEGSLSDGVLDAFDETVPVDLEEEDLLSDDEDEEAIDSGDFNADEW